MSRYSLIHLPAHLGACGTNEELGRLLLDFGWMHAKLEATDVTSLIADYDAAPNVWAGLVPAQSARPQGSPLQESWRLVQGALRLSAHVLAQDKTQLAGQLMGRLLDEDSSEIQGTLVQAAAWKRSAWLRPLAADLTPPGGPLLRTLTGHSGEVSAVAVTPDGKQAVSASGDKTLKVWDLETGRALRTLEGHSEFVNGVAVTPDGKRAVSASSDQTLKVWDLETGRALRTLEGHSYVSGVAVTPDGKRAVSASYDNTRKVWDLETGEMLATFTCDHAALCCAFDDDKRTISGDAGGRVHFLSLEEPKRKK